MMEARLSDRDEPEPPRTTQRGLLAKAEPVARKETVRGLNPDSLIERDTVRELVPPAPPEPLEPSEPAEPSAPPIDLEKRASAPRIVQRLFSVPPGWLAKPKPAEPELVREPEPEPEPESAAPSAEETNAAEPEPTAPKRSGRLLGITLLIAIAAVLVAALAWKSGTPSEAAKPTSQAPTPATAETVAAPAKPQPAIPTAASAAPAAPTGPSVAPAATPRAPVAASRPSAPSAPSGPALKEAPAPPASADPFSRPF